MRLRKALVACSAAVATVSAGVGLASRRWRAPALQAAEHAGADVDEWQSLTDYLHAASDGTVHAGRTLALCLRSATAAWERRQAALAKAGAGGSATRPSSAVLLADFLAELHDAPPEQRPRRIVFQQLSDYLLERATAPLADPAEKRAILRYLAAALRSDDAAQALLRSPGAAPKLLQLAADSQSLQQLLGVQLSRAVPPKVVSPEDVAAVMQLLSVAAAQQRQRGRGLGSQQQQQVLLTLEVLLRWAGASAHNANLQAEAGAGNLLADLAALTATGSGVDGLQSRIAQLMGTLARECNKPQQLRMQGWLYHLLCFAADASANCEWQLADASLNSLAACLLRGCELPVQLMQRSCLPLLRQLAAQRGLPVRPAIAHVVQALAEGPGVQLPAAEREFWSEALLQWLVELPGGGGDATAAAAKRSSSSSSRADAAEQQELMSRVARALEALSAPAGSDGLHVAHGWLAELIVHLSHQVRPYTEVPAPQAADAEAAASSWRWYWPFGGSGSQEAGDATAAAAVAGSLPPLPPAGTDLPAMSPGPSPDGPYLPLEPASASEATAGGSWWNPTSWWPWGGAAPQVGSEQQQQQQPSVKASGKPSDSELALYINAAAIGPVYARSVAAALLEASGRVGLFQEPPVEAEELMSPDVVAVYPQVAAAIDMDMADSAVCSALKVLCALASGGSTRRSWLLDAGILPLLHRLTMERARDVAELPSSAGAYVEDGIPLCIQRQAVRLLAMLASDKAGAAAVQDAGWIPWLQDLAVSSDLKLSSCASRALLHIESAAAAQRPGLTKLALPLHAVPAPLLPLEQQGAAAAGAGEAAAGDAARPPSPVVAEAAEMLGEARQKMAQVRRRLDRQLDAVRPAVPEQQRLVMQDGVHLFDPLAAHHEVLAREGITTDASDAPLLDIVFVHGIRGGAFATWRREGVLERGQARESLDRSVCWPASWVAKEIPDARLLSLEYAAPASGWEGESLPFRHTVHQLMEKLAAAGVGQRPVIFVCHSMGGLVVKDLLVTAKAQKDERLRKINTSAAGAVFYSVPHAGSRLADWGWYLRYIGGAPAKHVQQLKTGPHLEELNAAVRAMCKSGQLAVLSFSEGQPTRLGYIPTHVVPHESAYPGYGDFVVLHDHDHISVCKPSDQADPAYAKLMAFLHTRVRALRKERADAAAASMDHMEAATM